MARKLHDDDLRSEGYENFMSNLSISNSQNIININTRHDKALRNVNAKIASGLENPNPATNPSTSTQSKSIEGSLTITRRIASIAQQLNNTLQIADTVLNANAEILTQMRAHAVAAINGTNTDTDRRDINLSFQEKLALITENAEAKWGSRTLLDGTFSVNYLSTNAAIKQANVPGSLVASDLVVGDLTINGQDIGTVTGDASAIAAAINNFSSTTQVTASASTSATGSGNFVSRTVANPSILINGITVPLGEFAGTESSGQIVDQAVAAINAFDDLADEHIVAENVDGFLQIRATDGRNLSIGYQHITAQNVWGPSVGDYAGSITLSSVLSITIGGNTPDAAGFTSGLTQASGVKTVTLADMRAEALFDSVLPDISSQMGAEAALAAIDAAINKISTERTKIANVVIGVEHIEENMAGEALSLSDALAGVRDADLPEAITESARLEVLKQSAMAALQREIREFAQLGDLVGETLHGS